jgi:hypothetical protein
MSVTIDEVKRTPLFAVYLHRLYSLAVAMRDGCDDVFRLAAPPAHGMYIKVDPMLHSRIEGILIDAANIRRLVETDPKRRKNESRRTYDLRLARSRSLASLVRQCDLSAMLDSRVRNSVEHFDEYLDHLNAKLAGGEEPPGPSVAYNMTLSHWRAFKPPPYPLRLYVVEEHTYYNFGRAIDLNILRSQADQLAEWLLTSGVLGSADSPGGLLVVLEQKGRESG